MLGMNSMLEHRNLVSGPPIVQQGSYAPGARGFSGGQEVLLDTQEAQALFQLQPGSDSFDNLLDLGGFPWCEKAEKIPGLFGRFSVEVN